MVSAILPKGPPPVVVIAIMVSFEFPAATVPTTVVVIIVTVPPAVAIKVVAELLMSLVPIASVLSLSFVFAPSLTFVSFIGERKGWHCK